MDKLEKIKLLDVGNIKQNENLANHCTWKIGGPAKLLIEPLSIIQLKNVLQFSSKEEIPHVVIGRGSNLLFSDKGFYGIVIKLEAQFSNYSITGNKLISQAGAWVPGLCRTAAVSGLSGIEHTIGIPCTIGGLVYMNGGSLRKNIGESLIKIETINSMGEIKNYLPDECNFSYRHSIFQELNDVIITRVFLKLFPKNKHLIRKELLDILKTRRINFPLKQPSCGSVFKADEKMYNKIGPPGKVIDNLGLKGFRIGNAMISNKHANFFINLGGASSDDILALISYVSDKVYKATGFELSCEVKYVSETTVRNIS
ncbi:MAG TPA: UDP-N-acetylmuramate dehydrogenase [Victivallales bacterium]|nr:UDP-N-acetylmuramate dehydrogenase [Victivallales bacterium]